MSSRNPRMSPEPNDIIRWRDRERHVISVQDCNYTGRYDKKVTYFEVRVTGHRAQRSCSLSSYRKWAQRIEAKVIQPLETMVMDPCTECEGTGKQEGGGPCPVCDGTGEA